MLPEFWIGLGMKALCAQPCPSIWEQGRRRTGAALGWGRSAELCMRMLSVVPPSVSHHNITSDCQPCSCFALPAHLLQADARSCWVITALRKVFCMMEEEPYFWVSFRYKLVLVTTLMLLVEKVPAHVHVQKINFKSISLERQMEQLRVVSLFFQLLVMPQRNLRGCVLSSSPLVQTRQQQHTALGFKWYIPSWKWF